MFTGTLEKSEVLFLCLFLEGEEMNEENVMTTNEMNREERMPFFRILKAIVYEAGIIP